MTKEFRADQKELLKGIGQVVFENLRSEEYLTVTFSGEESLFMRVNQAKVRQASQVTQASLSLNFISGRRQVERSISLSGDKQKDCQQALDALEDCRKDSHSLPEDPFVVLPKKGESIEEEHFGKGLPIEEVASTLLKPAQGLDLAGLYTSGALTRGYMNSMGQFHWFSTDNFYFDYSLYTPSQKAIKASYAGTHWDTASYLAGLQDAKLQLQKLETKPRKIERGKYRIFLAPSAVAEIMNVLSWRAMSGAAFKQGTSPFKKLMSGESKLSPLVSLIEDFSLGHTTRFNEFGDVAPQQIPLIQNGKLQSLLVNQRTAKEYEMESNGANSSESLRSVSLAPGRLKEEDILSELGTGLFISNLHYLNWSDVQKGRITGMTRYGCFWVEDGRIVAPIEDMRFDESVFHFWGEGLESLTNKAILIPSTHSYEERSLGGVTVPGMLVNDFSLTY